MEEGEPDGHKINCLIVDDEPAGRKSLENLVGETEFLNLVASVGSPAKALPFIKEGNVQLLFLDVQMPGMSGVEFLRSLSDPPMAIVVSAHSEYAIQGYDLEVIDYLLKPVSRERFMRAAQKSKEFHELKRRDRMQDTDKRSHFFVKCNNQFERINFSELLYLEAANNYVQLQTADRRLSSYITFKTAAGFLPQERFIQVHKSFIVALDKISSFEGDRLSIGGHQIPVSRTYRRNVMEKVISSNVIRRPK